jgi:hypothetical protein
MDQADFDYVLRKVRAAHEAELQRDQEALREKDRQNSALAILLQEANNKLAKTTKRLTEEVETERVMADHWANQYEKERKKVRTLRREAKRKTHKARK